MQGGDALGHAFFIGLAFDDAAFGGFDFVALFGDGFAVAGADGFELHQRLANDRQRRDEGRGCVRTANDDVAGAANHHAAMAGGTVEGHGVFAVDKYRRGKGAIEGLAAGAGVTEAGGGKAVEKDVAGATGNRVGAMAGSGQVVGSVTRAAGFPDMNTCLSFGRAGKLASEAWGVNL